MKTLVLLLVQVLVSKCAPLTKDLNILVMAPWLNPDDAAWNIAPALIPAARLAADQINRRTDLLQGYTLKLLEGESGCRFTSKTMINFMELEFYNSIGYGAVGMVGPACSESIMATAHQINQSILNFMQISISLSPNINGNNYINSFRIVPPAYVYVDAWVSLMAVAKWKRVGIVYDNRDDVYIGVFSQLKRKINNRQIFPLELSARLDHKYALRKADEKNIRILFVLTGIRTAQKILCEKFSYLNFQLVFMDLTQEDLLNNDLFSKEDTLFCSMEELQVALNNTIFITNRYKREDVTANNTFAGISYQTYQDHYHVYFDKYKKENHLVNMHMSSAGIRYSNAYYDAVWALAIALNYSQSHFNLTDYSYHCTEQQRKVNMGTYVRKSLKEDVHFEGMSGSIHFDATSRALPGLGVVLNQTIFLKTARKWQFSTGSFINKKLALNTSLVFLPYSLETTAYNIGGSVPFTLLAAAALAVVCFASLQVALLSLKEKSSSPQLDFLILSGCCLYFSVLLLYTIQTVFPNNLHHHELVLGVGCNLQFWCFSVAFTLIFGTVCAKTWRIYKIFKYFKQGRVRYVSDPLLIGAIISLVVLDVVYLIAWTLSDPWLLDKWEEREGLEIIRYHFCSCNNMAWWSAGLLIQKMVLMSLAVVLSIMVRSVKRRGFKNTKSILILIYSLLIVHVVGIFTHILLQVLQILHILNFLSYSLTFMLTLIIITLNQFLTHIWPLLKRRIKSRVHRAAMWTMIETTKNSSLGY